MNPIEAGFWIVLATASVSFVVALAVSSLRDLWRQERARKRQ